MDKKYTGIIIGLVVIALGVVSVGFFQSFRANTGPDETPPIVEEKVTRTITAKHQWSDGVHIVAGEIETPTPCHILDTPVSVDTASDPDRAVIDFNVTQNDGEVCIQVIASQRFKVSFEADENADISARYNADPAILNLIEALPDEDLNDFELFIKG